MGDEDEGGRFERSCLAGIWHQLVQPLAGVREGHVSISDHFSLNLSHEMVETGFQFMHIKAICPA